MDPMFAGILANGWIPAGARILDLGCGQGLLASLLLAVDEAAAEPGAWPADWQPPPVGCSVHGLELMPKDVERARAALAAHQDRALIEQADIARAQFAPSDVVTILDVLHYIPYAAQEDVLARVYACLSDGGTLLLRVGDKAGGLPFGSAIGSMPWFSRCGGMLPLPCIAAPWRSGRRCWNKSALPARCTPCTRAHHLPA